MKKMKQNDETCIRKHVKCKHICHNKETNSLVIINYIAIQTASGILEQKIHNNLQLINLA